MNYRVRADCRLCGSSRLTKVLDLGTTPLANELPAFPMLDQEQFPLYLVDCDRCGHVQLPVVVNPSRLFRDYVYVSGTSAVFVDHLQRYAHDVRVLHMKPGELAVEIGSNDGTLLRSLATTDVRVLGIDPAVEIAAAATESGVETWPEFFTTETAQRIVATRGHAKVVLANNVFAHADDLRGMATAIKSLLTDDGVFVFEVSYLVDVIEKTLFDTVYHEHLAYHSLGPLSWFFADLGMSLVDAERVPTHGGSIRVTVSRSPGQRSSDRLCALIAAEEKLGLPLSTELRFAELRDRIDDRKRELRRLLLGAKMGGKRIAAYGAPAKATTLLHSFDLHREVFDYVVDDSQHKQGRYLPGTAIPIVPSSALEDRRPDYVVILAWNFADSIVVKLAPFIAGGGKVVVPLPNVTVHG
jgi:hypothetical protein